MKNALTLEVYCEGAYSSTLRFENRDFLKIGRLPTCDVSIDEDGVGRIHAVIESALDGSGYFITQMTSIGSTYLNGGELSKAKLRLGDEIRIGDYAIRVVRRRPKVRRRTKPSPPKRDTSTARINVPEMLQLPWADEEDIFEVD